MKEKGKVEVKAEGETVGREKVLTLALTSASTCFKCCKN